MVWGWAKLRMYIHVSDTHKATVIKFIVSQAIPLEILAPHSLLSSHDCIWDHVHFTNVINATYNRVARCCPIERTEAEAKKNGGPLDPGVCRAESCKGLGFTPYYRTLYS